MNITVATKPQYSKDQFCKKLQNSSQLEFKSNVRKTVFDYLVEEKRKMNLGK